MNGQMFDSAHNISRIKHFAHTDYASKLAHAKHDGPQLSYNTTNGNAFPSSAQSMIPSRDMKDSI